MTGRPKANESCTTPDWLAERYGSNAASAAVNRRAASSFEMYPGWSATRSVTPSRSACESELVHRAPEVPRDDEADVEARIDERERLEREVDALVGPDRAERHEEEVRVPPACPLRRNLLAARSSSKIGDDEAGMKCVEHWRRGEVELGELLPLVECVQDEEIRMAEHGSSEPMDAGVPLVGKDVVADENPRDRPRARS